MELDIDLLKPHELLPHYSVHQVTDSDVHSARLHGFTKLTDVRKLGDGVPVEYEIISDIRPWVIAQVAGIHQIPVNVISGISDERAGQLVKISQAGQNPIERAERLRATLDDNPTLTLDALAKQLGEQQGTLSNRLSLLRLAPEVQEMVRYGELPAGKARVLKKLKHAEQRQLAERSLREKLSVRELEVIVRQLRTKTVGVKSLNMAASQQSNSCDTSQRNTLPALQPKVLESAEDIASRKIGEYLTKTFACTSILSNGKLVIEYYGDNDILGGILDHLGYQSD